MRVIGLMPMRVTLFVNPPRSSAVAIHASPMARMETRTQQGSTWYSGPKELT
jgi:hypothetical protein